MTHEVVNPTPPIAPQPQSGRPKRYATAIGLSLAGGTMGIDRFYLGYVGLGILKLLTGGGFGIWALVDSILLLQGKLGSADGSPLEQSPNDKKYLKIAVIVYYVSIGVTVLLSIGVIATSIFIASTNPKAFSSQQSSTQELTRDEVYAKLSVGMSESDAKEILSNAKYSKNCSKSTDANGTIEDCTYWRFSWQDNDQIIVRYVNGKVFEIRQFSSDDSTNYNPSILES